MILTLAFIGILVIGVVLGLMWHGIVLVGDRRAVDRLAAQLVAEVRMQNQTHATLQAMRQMARGYGHSSGAEE